MMIDTVVFDIDGTLTDRNSGQVPISVKHAVKQLKEQKMLILIATGRPFFEVDRHLITMLEPDAIICNNGQRIVGSDGYVFHETPIDPELLKRALHYIEEKGWDCAMHMADHTLVLKGESIQQTIARVTHKKPILKRAKGFQVESSSFNIMVHASPVEITEFIASFPELKAEAFDEGYYDIYPIGVDKADGISYVLEKKRKRWTSLMAFGDAENDVRMLKKAYYGVAMEDGDPILKQIKGIHTSPAAKDDGIFKTLLKFGFVEYPDDRKDYARFKHRFITTSLRYVLPISFFLYIAVVYDAMRGALNSQSFINGILGTILLAYAIHLYIKPSND